jgi:hypothetical protein
VAFCVPLTAGPSEASFYLLHWFLLWTKSHHIRMYLEHSTTFLLALLWFQSVNNLVHLTDISMIWHPAWLHWQIGFGNEAINMCRLDPFHYTNSLGEAYVQQWTSFGWYDDDTKIDNGLGHISCYHYFIWNIASIYID